MLLMIAKIILVICSLGCVMCVIEIIGSWVNCEIHCKLIDAIVAYRIKYHLNQEYEKYNLVDCDDIYEFNGIQNCFPWLWRYKKHLPAEKYEIIKPFISNKRVVI